MGFGALLCREPYKAANEGWCSSTISSMNQRLSLTHTHTHAHTHTARTRESEDIFSPLKLPHTLIPTRCERIQLQMCATVCAVIRHDWRQYTGRIRWERTFNADANTHTHHRLLMNSMVNFWREKCLLKGIVLTKMQFVIISSPLWHSKLEINLFWMKPEKV